MCSGMYVDTHYKIRHTWTQQLRKTIEQMKGKPRERLLFLSFPVYIWLFFCLPCWLNIYDDSHILLFCSTMFDSHTITTNSVPILTFYALRAQ